MLIKTRRSKITIQKTHASNDFKSGKISQEEKDSIYETASKNEKVIKDYKDYLVNQK